MVRKKITVKKAPAPEHADDCCKPSTKNTTQSVYGLGMIGAAIFYIQHATSFWLGALGLLKAIVWPAFVVYKLLEFLK